MAESRMGVVLIAEDEEDIRSLITYIFEREHFQVLQVGDGRSALDTFTRHMADISLVITDVGLPGLGGIALIKRIRELKPSMKIIGTSGYSRLDARREILEAGGDEFIPKPFVIDDLLRVSKELLNKL